MKTAFCRALTAVVMACCCAATAPAQLSFNVSSSGNSQADAAFALAADAWSTEFSDLMTVNLSITFSNLGGVTLASSEAVEQTNSFLEFTNAIDLDGTSGDDRTFFGGLPTGTSFSPFINRTTESSGFDFEVPYVDSDGGANNATVRLTTANAKALGLRSADDPLLDATIFFNDSFAWDYDRTDGIDPGAIDFTGVAMHEIGHALGFISGVDVLDANGDGLSNDDEFDYVSPIDFLRHSSESISAGADIDWTADDREKFLSIDGGASSLVDGSGHWSTGFEFGDGEQASHWKQGQMLGIMEPTTGAGLIAPFSSNDLIVFDVIGYDRIAAVPEPAGGIIAGLALLALCRRRRSRHR